MSIDQSFVALKPLLGFLGLLLIILGCVEYYVGERKVINQFVGFRVPPTYRNSEVWRAVNMRAGLLTVLHGMFVTIAGLVVPKMGLSTFLLILLLPLAAVIIYGTLYAYQLEKIFE